MGVAARVTARLVAFAIVLTAVVTPPAARSSAAPDATTVVPAATAPTISARGATDSRTARPRSRLTARASERAHGALLRPLALAVQHDLPAAERSLVGVDHVQPAHARTTVPDEPTAARDPPAS